MAAPRMTYPLAARLLSFVPGLAEITRSSIGDLKVRGKLPAVVADALYKHLHPQQKVFAPAPPPRVVNPLQPMQSSAPVQNPLVAARGDAPPPPKKTVISLRMAKK
jgi:hypothetical protein